MVSRNFINIVVKYNVYDSPAEDTKEPVAEEKPVEVAPVVVE